MAEKVISIRQGNVFINYYYWDEYKDKEDAVRMAKKLKIERKVKTYIRTVEQGIIYPETVQILYLNKKLKII